MTRALVTGAAGFIGAVLARALSASGCETHVVTRPGGDTWRLRDAGDWTAHQLSLTDAEAVSALLHSVRPNWIFHMAAHGAYPSQRDSRRIVEDTLLATVTLLDAAAAIGFDAFVHAGTSSEYGLRDRPPEESDPLQPNSTYAVGKAAATMYCSHVGRARGLKVVTARLYSVYGPFEAPERLIPTLLVHARRGTLPPLVDARTERDFVHVDDVIQAMLMLAGESRVEPGSVFNVGSGRQTTIGEIVSLVSHRFGVTEEPTWGSYDPRAWDTFTWRSDPSRLLSLGWRPATCLADGLDRTMEWLVADDERWRYYESRVDTAVRTAKSQHDRRLTA